MYKSLDEVTQQKAHGSYLQGMETSGVLHVSLLKKIHTDPTYKEWKQFVYLDDRETKLTRILPTRNGNSGELGAEKRRLQRHGSYLQGMETIGYWYG